MKRISGFIIGILVVACIWFAFKDAKLAGLKNDAQSQVKKISKIVEKTIKEQPTKIMNKIEEKNS